MKAIIYPGSLECITVIADSAIGRDVQPLFLPPGQWQGRLAWAVRIGRLGKSVAPKFAMRYVDAMAPALLTEPAGERRAWAAIADSALIPGAWVPIEDCAASAEASIQLPDRPSDDDICRAVADITRYATIKTGDIIVFSLGAPCPLQPGIAVTAPGLNVRVK